MEGDLLAFTAEQTERHGGHPRSRSGSLRTGRQALGSSLGSPAMKTTSCHQGFGDTQGVS